MDDVATFLDVSSSASVLPLTSIRPVTEWLGGKAGTQTVPLLPPSLASELVLEHAVERIRWLRPDRLFATHGMATAGWPDAVRDVLWPRPTN